MSTTVKLLMKKLLGNGDFLYLEWKTISSPTPQHFIGFNLDHVEINKNVVNIYLSKVGL